MRRASSAIAFLAGAVALLLATESAALDFILKNCTGGPIVVYVFDENASGNDFYDATKVRSWAEVAEGSSAGLACHSARCKARANLTGVLAYPHNDISGDSCLWKSPAESAFFPIGHTACLPPACR